MSKPLITIALPTYNSERTIKKAIDSCLSQIDLNDCEILVVDNASKDRTWEILASYGERIRVVTNRETVSLFENHNIALKYSLGDYIIFCHSDDILYPEAVKILKRRLSELDYPNKFICWGHSHFRDFSIALKACGFYTGQVFAGQYAINPFLLGGVTPSGTCYSRSFYEIGGFLDVQHKLAPSDASSMINAALHGFRFEMMQAILLKRTDASTLSTKIGSRDLEEGYANAFTNLIMYIGNEKTAEIIQSSCLSAEPPLNFYLVTSKMYPKIVVRRIIRLIIDNPKYLVKRKIYRILIIGMIGLFNA
jgi:glycosyltransferase involved in cell wall biosynthesis